MPYYSIVIKGVQVDGDLTVPIEVLKAFDKKAKMLNFCYTNLDIGSILQFSTEDGLREDDLLTSLKALPGVTDVKINRFGGR